MASKAWIKIQTYRTSASYEGYMNDLPRHKTTAKLNKIFCARCHEEKPTEENHSMILRYFRCTDASCAAEGAKAKEYCKVCYRSVFCEYKKRFYVYQEIDTIHLGTLDDSIYEGNGIWKRGILKDELMQSWLQAVTRLKGFTSLFN